MKRFTGRSKDILTIPSKPTPEGYKIWVIAEMGYVLHWCFYSRGKQGGPVNIGKILKELGTNKTAAVVAYLLDQLPRPLAGYTYGVFLDNLFTSRKLLVYLAKKGYGATGTARTNSGVFQKFVDLKKLDKKQDKVSWGILERAVTQDNVMQFAWKDNSIVLFQSTMYDGGSWTSRERKRPSTTSTSAKTARKPFGDNPRALLDIPDFDDGYNHHMGYVDLADQLRNYYQYQRPCHYSIDALFSQLWEMSLTNAYLLSLHSPVPKEAKFTSHKKFLEALYQGLLGLSERRVMVRRKRSIGLSCERPTVRMEEHYHCKMEALGDCRGCKGSGETARPKKRRVFSEISPNLGTKRRGKRTTFGCSICNVHLCKQGNCWATWHNIVA